MLLRQALSIHGAVLTNDILEETSTLQPLVDGVDSTIFDLAAEEIGEEELSRIAMTVAHETFAFEHLDADTRILLEEVFRLRAQRVANVYSSGRFAWIRETGAKMRLVDTVEAELLPKLEDWSELTDPLEPRLVAALFQWAWGQVDVQAAVRKAYELDDGIATATVQKSFNAMVDAWLSGARWVEIATRSDRTVDEALNIYAQVLAYVIQSNIDQGVALLDRVLQSQDLQLADSVKSFPNHLRFGVPNAGARALAEAGVRHRHACVEFGRIPAVAAAAESQTDVVGTARSTLESRREEFQTILGLLVYKRTLRDLTQRRGR